MIKDLRVYNVFLHEGEKYIKNGLWLQGHITKRSKKSSKLVSFRRVSFCQVFQYIYLTCKTFKRLNYE